MPQYTSFEEENYRTQVQSEVPPLQAGYPGSTMAGDQPRYGRPEAEYIGFYERPDAFAEQKVRPMKRPMTSTTWWRLAIALISVFATVSLTHGILGDLSDAVGASPFLIITRLIGLLIMGAVIVTVNIVVNRNN